jgi:hypothetical protein
MISELPSYATLLFSESAYSPVIQNRRSQFEAGYIRQAPVDCRRLIQVAVTYALCSAENALAFSKWIDNDLKSGSQWFLWTHPIRSNANDLATKVRARIVNGVYSMVAKNRAQEAFQCSFTVEYYSDGGI